MRRPVLVVAAVLLVAGCGAEDDSGSGAEDSGSGAAVGPVPTVTAADLDGSTYVSSDVVGHDLVAGTEVRLAFEDATMAVAAGCNTQTGPYAVTDGDLAWTQPPAATLIGCAEDRQAQDDWLGELLLDGVAATLVAGELTLEAGDVVLTLSETPGTDLTAVLGQPWTVVATVDKGTTTPIPAGVRRPRLSVGADGLASIDTGCNNGRTTVRVDGETLVFGRPQVTRGACTGPAQAVQDAVLDVLDGRADAVALDGATLVLTTGDRGLVVEVG